MEDDLIIFTVRLYPETKAKLDAEAEKKMITSSQLVRIIITDYFRKASK